MASKVEALYTQTLLHTMRLLRLTETLFLPEMEMSAELKAKLRREISSEMKVLQKSRKKIEGKMTKLKELMFDPIWLSQHPHSKALSPTNKETKKAIEGFSMENMKSTSLHKFYQTVDNLHLKT